MNLHHANRGRREQSRRSLQSAGKAGGLSLLWSGPLSLNPLAALPVQLQKRKRKERKVDGPHRVCCSAEPSGCFNSSSRVLPAPRQMIALISITDSGKAQSDTLICDIRSPLHWFALFWRPRWFGRFSSALQSCQSRGPGPHVNGWTGDSETRGCHSQAEPGSLVGTLLRCGQLVLFTVFT